MIVPTIPDSVTTRSFFFSDSANFRRFSASRFCGTIMVKYITTMTITKNGNIDVSASPPPCGGATGGATGFAAS